MSKKVLMAGVVVSLFLSMLANGFAAVDNNPVIELNGIKLQTVVHSDRGDVNIPLCAHMFTSPGLDMESGRNVYIPLRAVAEALGYRTDWSEKDRTVTVFKAGKNIMIDLKNNKITANDHAYYMSGDCSGTAADDAVIFENRTYMGMGFFADNFGLKVLWDRQGGKVRLESIKENAISIKTVKVDSEKEKLKITLQYPEIQGLDDKTVQDGINSFFVKSAVNAANEGLQNADEMARDTDGHTGSPNKCETYFDYRLKYNQNGLLSVVLTDYQYAGGAHGLTVQSSRTVNLKTGEAYELKDLFKGDADYVSLISSTVRDQINERVKAGILPENAITPFRTIKADQDFYLSDHGMVVYFQQYEYFPYAAGIQEFSVDYSSLKDMLKSDFSFLNDDPKLLESYGTRNSLNAGETGRVILKGNPTTGYTWHYTIENSDVVKPYSEKENRDSGMTGAGRTYKSCYNT